MQNSGAAKACTSCVSPLRATEQCTKRGVGVRVLPRSALYNGVLRREVMRFAVLIVFLGASLGEASLVVNDCRVRPPKVAYGLVGAR